MPGAGVSVLVGSLLLSGNAVKPVGGEYQKPSWLPDAHLDDFDCRKRSPATSVVDWQAFRVKLSDYGKAILDPLTLKPLREVAASAGALRLPGSSLAQLAGVALHALLRFEEAFGECPLGAITASIFLTCLAHEAKSWWSRDPFLEPALAELRRQSLNDLLVKDLQLMLGLTQPHTIAATEWPVFPLLTFHVERKSELLGEGACAGTSVSGWSAESVRNLLLVHMPFASGRDIQGIKFLRGLDPLVSKVMGDPADFSLVFMKACPPGAAAFAAASTMLSLMTNPVLFHKFANLLTHVLVTEMPQVVAGAAAWGVFHGLSKIKLFATRGFDLEWSLQEIMPLPANIMDFDAARTDAESRQRRLLEASQNHGHRPTRELAFFLSRALARESSEELIVYLSAAGGHPFNNYIDAFIARAKFIGLPALILACMDEDAASRCRDAASRYQLDGNAFVHCSDAFEGHVVLVKHRLLPTLLSASVDTVWIDFDTFLARDPTEALLAQRNSPPHILPERSRVRFGSFLFSNASDICGLTKICDPRQHWNYTVEDASGTEASESDGSVDMLVTEHWDARCLNNGLFYVSANHRTLVFFTLFLLQLYNNPYADNQNLLDAFLAHSTVDETVPARRPLLRYALLDIERLFTCAEGHGSSMDEMLTFHFWSSDFRTRETGRQADAETGNKEKGTIVSRGGMERVSKARASKSELFDLFYGPEAQASGASLPAAAVDFFSRVHVELPSWKGMCSVTAVGVEDLVDERMLQHNHSLVDWASAAAATTVANVPSSLESSPATRGELQSEDQGQDGSGSCLGIAWPRWVDALRTISHLQDRSLLSEAEASALKARLRRLEQGLLMTIEAFSGHGADHLARELLQAL